MKNLPLCTTLLALPACLPLEVYYREGASVQALNRDTTTCPASQRKAVQSATRTAPIKS